MEIAMKQERLTPESDRITATYANLTQNELREYVGKVIAVSTANGEILESADSVVALREIMELRFADVCYRTLPITDLSKVTDFAESSD